ncbi:hypothetical protein RSOLAG22IIIB_00392 [Rhizoctonia solani]|uniref:F-box domain-containing protein n=1 Tax=Rhizoctonia solani TaxID=456999 RepID=A0A0K6FL35_9AGAM|nr:hypothetical protein RSOLAG22IIIB_00392 [Rhizoctonia solani]
MNRAKVVCRRWRKIALDTTPLWTRVGIADDPIAYRRTKLHLSRCGSVAQLDLMIDMFGPTWDQMPDGAVEECVQRVNTTFSSLIDAGGITSRWRCCSIQTTKFHAYLAILQFLKSADFPSLEYLEVVFSQTDEVWDVEQVAISEQLESAPELLFQNTPPRLKTARLLGIPNPYMFGHSAHPQLTGLTHLQLGLIAQNHELHHLNRVLAASPQLKALSLSSISFYEGASVGSSPSGEPITNQLPKIHLHNLQSLALPDIDCAPWALGIVMMLDAPNVKALRIGYAGEPEGHADYHRFLNYLVWNAEECTEDSRPCFPNLTHLSYESSEESAADLQLLLTEYTTLQSLEIPLVPYFKPVLNRSKSCWMVPNLKRLRVLEVDRMAEVKRTVMARHKAGMGLEHIEVVYDEEIPDLKPNDKKKLDQLVNLVLTRQGRELEDLVWCY